MELDGLTYPAGNVKSETLELPYSRWSKKDLEPHSGQIIARLLSDRERYSVGPTWRQLHALFGDRALTSRRLRA
jgi:hypothetical protein